MAEYNEVIKDLQKGVYAPIYFLQGDEPFFIDNIVENIEENALDESQKGFNQYVLYGKEVSFTDVLNVARKYPMMGERQVVIIKEAQEIKDWKKEDTQNLLMAYLENPLPSTILVLAHKYKSLDKRTKVAKVLAKQAVFIDSKKIYDNQLPAWVQAYAGAKSAKVTDKAVMILCENIGNNLQRLANEIDKLSLNVKDGEPIDDAAVQKFVGISKDYNVFELQKALSLRNETKAYQIVKFFAANPSANPLVLIISNLYQYFVKLLILHQNGARDKNEAARLIGVNPFFAGEYLQAARNFPLPTVVKNIQAIHKADLQSKGIGSASMKEGDILIELMFNLLH
ncbi:DNA polymerase III subunit delta [Marinoscillum sp. MHG1-6]|uniref:DNA polymerase III subunit delta n=1 Tax=Marinoscillum sp. MHG1-6 TaxID=2959627 RepID=UPI002157FEEE|nr:DNA polymerase III subunit delta [Marinoscillum sp. MHG1-6]